MSVINLTRKKSNHQNMMKERELFYVDEELAKTKMEKKKIPETVKKEEKDLSIDDMLKLFVKEDDEKKPVKKGISFNIDTDNSKWHS